MAPIIMEKIASLSRAENEPCDAADGAYDAYPLGTPDGLRRAASRKAPVVSVSPEWRIAAYECAENALTAEGENVMDFKGRTVIVTGAASGMGEATAREFAAAGAHVVVVDIDVAGAERVASEIGALPAVVGDLGDPEFCRAAVAAAVKRHGRLDILVNAAGIIVRASGEQTTDAQWRRIMATNLDGVFFMCREAVKIMKAQGRGAIVNFGSIWGDVGAAGVAAYCATKGGVHQLTRAMALDHVKDGIRINAVCPGEVDTPMLRSGRERPPSEDDMRAIAGTVPMGRLARPVEIAKVVLFLASDDASYMTGAMVTVDAGFTAR
jgi:meso-butanediol dehydrogenase / (S,S)-butanediol dehydrogenase / diacetyl reductase